MIVKIIGLILIVASFIFVLRRPDMSMMDTLMKQRKKKMEELINEEKKEEM